MTLATGGSACAATSTRSSPLVSAWASASLVGVIPSCAPSSSISRTRGARMFSLIRVCGTGRTGSTNRLGLKELSPSREFLPHKTTKPLQTSNGLRPRLSTRLNPHGALGSEGEERVPPLLAGSQGTKFCEQRCEALRRLLSSTLADGERVLRFLVPVDDHVRDLLDLGVPDSL